MDPETRLWTIAALVVAVASLVFGYLQWDLARRPPGQYVRLDPDQLDELRGSRGLPRSPQPAATEPPRRSRRRQLQTAMGALVVGGLAFLVWDRLRAPSLRSSPLASADTSRSQGTPLNPESRARLSPVAPVAPSSDARPDAPSRSSSSSNNSTQPPEAAAGSTRPDAINSSGVMGQQSGGGGESKACSDERSSTASKQSGLLIDLAKCGTLVSSSSESTRIRVSGWMVNISAELVRVTSLTDWRSGALGSGGYIYGWNANSSNGVPCEVRDLGNINLPVTGLYRNMPGERTEQLLETGGAQSDALSKGGTQRFTVFIQCAGHVGIGDTLEVSARVYAGSGNLWNAIDYAAEHMRIISNQ